MRRRKGGLAVWWMMGGWERRGWAEEIRGLFSLDEVRRGAVAERRGRIGDEVEVEDAVIKETPRKEILIKATPLKENPITATPIKDTLDRSSIFQKTSKGGTATTPQSPNSSQSSSTTTAVSQRLSERSSSSSPATSFYKTMDMPKRQVPSSLGNCQTLLHFPVRKSSVQTHPFESQVGEKDSHQTAFSIQKSLLVPTNVVKHHHQTSFKRLAASDAKKRPGADTSTIENSRNVKRLHVEQPKTIIDSEAQHEAKQEQKQQPKPISKKTLKHPTRSSTSFSSPAGA